MKVLKSLFLCVGTVLLALNFTACTDWGDADPEAGNQTYPDRSVVSTYAFDYGADDVYLGDITDKADVCEAVEDADLGSNVLHLDANGYAVMANPFNGVKLQNGAAITFWLKTAGIPQEAAEGEDPIVEDDLTGAVLAFGSDEAGAERFYLTANGQLKYTKPGNLESLNLNENDPATYKTGVLPAGGWHFVALQISEEGYQLYVDGNKSLSGATPSGAEATTFSYKTLIDFLNTAPNIYIGKGAGDDDVDMSEMWIDDVKLIRNQMIASDWAMPNKGGGGVGDDFEYMIGEPVNTIGAVDNSSAFWTEFSNYFRIPANTSMHFQFVNYTSGVENYHNWLLGITNDADRGAANYSEFFVMRQDVWGWGTAWDASRLTSSGFNWDTFKTDINGATVDVTISRKGDVVYVTNVTTCTNGLVLTQEYNAVCGTENEVIRAVFSVEQAHLEMNWDNCYVRQDMDVTKTEVGSADNSVGFFADFSDYFTIPANMTLELNFTNYSDCQNNWDNFIAVVTSDAERGASDYYEHFVLRADIWGWGTEGGLYNAANLVGEGYDDWNAFLQDMNGAAVKITIQRVGAEVYYTSEATTAGGHVYKMTYHQTCGDGTENLRAFLSCEKAHLVMDPTNCFLSASLVK